MFVGLLLGAACGGATDGSTSSASSALTAEMSTAPVASASAPPTASAVDIASSDRRTATNDDPPPPEPELPPPPQPILRPSSYTYDDTAPPPPPPTRDEVFADSGPSPGVVMSYRSPGASPPPAQRAETPPKVLKQAQCAFPPEAKMEEATVHLRVRVSVDGKPASIRVLSDPGEGYGAAARTCMLSSTFSPGLDADGKPIEAETTVKIRFVR